MQHVLVHQREDDFRVLTAHDIAASQQLICFGSKNGDVFNKHNFFLCFFVCTRYILIGEPARIA